ncbi:MAG TPA: hypothetical protein VFM95_02660 [Microcella sp.]|nr:hypothetical protein [Microcella sp.]
MRDLALGALIGMCVLALPLACTSGRLPELVRCQLEALKVLPDDPYLVTVMDAIDVVERVRACHAAHDGGAP